MSQLAEELRKSRFSARWWAGLKKSVLEMMIMRELSAAGIGTQVHYFPVHLQPYYRKLYGDQDLTGASAYYARCLSLPLFPAMSDADVDRVIDALSSALGVS